MPQELQNLGGPSPETGTSQQAASSPESSAAPSISPAPSPASPGDPILSVLQEVGFDGQFKDGREAIRNLIESHRRYQDVEQRLPELQQMAGFGRQVLPHADKFREFLAAQQAQQQKAPAEEEKPWWPKPPEWDPTLERFLMRNEAGEVVVRPEYMGTVAPDLAQRYQARQRYEQERLQSIMADPVEAIWPGLEPRFGEIVEKRVSEALEQYRQQEFINSFVAANPWMFQLDAQGNAVRGADGQYLPSPEGQRFQQLVDECHASGVADPRVAASMAMRMMGQPANGRPQTPAPAPAQVGEAKRDLFRDRVLQESRSPNRDGTARFESDAPTQNSAASFLEIALQEMRRKGMTIPEI